MATFQAPPGHPAQSQVLILSQLSSYTLTIAAPDPDLQEPVLSLPDGQKLTGSKAIAEHVAGQAAENADAGKQDGVVLFGNYSAFEHATLKWYEPFSTSLNASDKDRKKAQADIETALAAIEGSLGASSYLAGRAAGAVDVCYAAALLPLLQQVLSEETRKPYPKTLAWIGSLLQVEAVKKVLGKLSLCPAVTGWVASAGPPKKDKKKKKGGAAADGAPQEPQPAASGDENLDPEKLAKKLAKQAEKEAKKAKALAKQQAAAAAAKSGGDEAANEKKMKAKAEAEAKKKAEEEEVNRAIAAAKATPKGEKKDVSMEMLRGYNPPAVEAAWYDWWEECGFFKPDLDSDKPPFVMVIPPPNVTGALHIGHALTNAVEDCITRWKRMSGYNTLWVPGTDHAGISCQTVVEKKLQREKGLSRHDLGRSKFLEEVHLWVDQYGNRIFSQQRRMGCSVDWSRAVFTMDAKRCAAVLEAFVQMYSKGIIYRDVRLVNWDCQLKTAVSDIEVDYVDIPKRTLISVPGYTDLVEFGVLTSFAYPFEGGEGEIVVATTRPETMLGDTAVAVHPEDPRYTKYHGKFVIHPMNGRKLPVVCDAELVDMSFGTGAVKITPAHDPNDFQVGKRHNLEFINVFDDNGMINDNGGQFKGQPRFKARVTVVEFLKEKGLFRGTSDNPMRLGVCSRSKDVIEPMIKPQWWVNCKDAAARGCKAVRDGDLQIVPKEFEPVWFRWLENIRDWCISRQLWWGHRIPAYYVVFEGEEGSGSGPGLPSEDMTRWVVGRDEAEATKAAEAKYPGKKFALAQDEDVLDTWFSSGLFPFSVFEWPNQTKDLAKFYPTTLLETGHDIIFFWVARMVIMGLTLTDQCPFKTVFLHAMVRDAHGRKMSKSLGNVIDPIHVIEGIQLEQLHKTLEGGNLDAKEINKAKAGQKADFPDGIEECGTDALRFALLAYTSQARDINLDIKRVVAYRHWCNKLWNAIKFAMLNLPAAFTPQPDVDPSSLPLPAQWILSRLNNAITVTNKAFEEYDFATGTQRLYSFWQYEVCDVFIEVTKAIMALDDSDHANVSAKESTRQVLWICLDTGLKLLHPCMPFVTEELWQRLPKPADKSISPSIMIASYPQPTPSWDNVKAEQQMEFVQAVVAAARKLRSDYGLTKQRPQLYVSCSDATKSASLSSWLLYLSALSTSSECQLLSAGTAAPRGCAVAIVDPSTTLHMLLKGVLDPALEIKKLDKQQKDAEVRLEQLKKKMATSAYVEKTPRNIKTDDEERAAKIAGEVMSIKQAMDDMKKLLEESQ